MPACGTFTTKSVSEAPRPPLYSPRFMLQSSALTRRINGLLAPVVPWAMRLVPSSYVIWMHGIVTVGWLPPRVPGSIPALSARSPPTTAMAPALKQLRHSVEKPAEVRWHTAILPAIAAALLSAVSAEMGSQRTAWAKMGVVGSGPP